MNPNRPVPIESRALVTLGYIRSSMEAASSLAVPGMAGVVMGAIGIAAAALASLPGLAAHSLEVWLVAAVVAFVLGGTLMARQASPRGMLLVAPLRKFLLCLCPGLLAGAVLTLVFWSAGMERLIPGMWLLLYGCAVIAASTVTNGRNLPLIATMGGIFVGLGGVTFVLPAGLHTLSLGVGFGALHVIFGILIARANHGD